MPIATRTFRVFVSSTFEDLIQERNALQHDVFPALRQLCEAHGARFQAIDLRWGVRDEAVLGQKMMEICLAEIERCQRTRIKPNFIVLIGDRYGKPPLPARVQAQEFKDVLRRVEKERDRDLIVRWYQLDENAMPEEYLLKPRAGEFVDGDRWKEVEDQLGEALRTAARAAELTHASLLKYEASASHREIEKGLGTTAEDRRHTFAFFRETDPAKEPAELKGLKKLLREQLKGNVVEYGRGDIAKLCEDVKERLEQVIRSEISGFASRSTVSLERTAHNRFARERRRHFSGRQPVLEAIAGYLRDTDKRPFVVHGASGCGKSAILARASYLAAAASRKAIIVRRFIGATPDSSSGFTLLRGLYAEIAQRYGRPQEIPVDFNQLVDDFRAKLAFATSGRHLYLFLDGLDQLGPQDAASQLAWLPSELPPNSWVVVSTTGMPLALRNAKDFPVPPLPLSEADVALKAWLEDAKRKLQADQLAKALDYFKRSGLPLYLRLVFEEARHWRSFDELAVCTLRDELSGIVDVLFDRLSAEANHGRVLVKRSLGYLAAARYGLTEDEILDLLSKDRLVWKDFEEHKRHAPPDRQLPVAVWSRLFHDLVPYLAERAAAGGILITFYHRQLAERIVEPAFAAGQQNELHRSLADYFQARWSMPELHALSELIYQLQESDEWDQLTRRMADPQFLDAHCRHFGPYELLSAGDACFSNGGATSPYRSVLTAVRDTLAAHETILAREPSILPQQLYLTCAESLTDDELISGLRERLAVQEKTYPLLRLQAGPKPPKQPLLRDFGVQNDYVPEVGISPDGSLVYSATMSGQIRAFEVRSGRMVGEALNDSWGARCLRVTWDGRVLVGLVDGRLIDWRGAGLPTSIFQSPRDYSINAVLELPQENTLLVAPGQWKGWQEQVQSSMLHFLAADTGKESGSLDLSERIVQLGYRNGREQHVAIQGGVQVNIMALRPGRREVAFAFRHGEVSLFDLDSREWRSVHRTHSQAMYGLAFDHSGRYLFFSDEKAVFGIDLEANRPVGIRRFDQGITAMAMTPLSRFLIVGDWIGLIHMLDPIDLTCVQSYPCEVAGCVRSICCDVRGGSIVAISGQGVRLFDLNTPGPDSRHVSDWGWHAMEAAGTPDQGYCLSTSNLGRARAVEVASGKVVSWAKLRSVRCAKRVGIALGIRNEQLGPRSLASLFQEGELDERLEVLSLPDLRAVATVHIPGLTAVHGMAMSGDGKLVACIGATVEGTAVFVRGLSEGGQETATEQRFPVGSQTAFYAAMTVSDDHSMIASVLRVGPENSESDGRIELDTAGQRAVAVWDLRASTVKHLAMDLPVSALAFDPEHQRLFVGYGSQWEIHGIGTSLDLYRVEVRQFRNMNPSEADFAMRVFCMKTAREIGNLRGHKGPINYLDVSADGRWLASVSDDRTLRIWETATSRMVALVGVEGRPVWCGFHSAGESISIAASGWRADLRLIPRTFSLREIMTADRIVD